MRYFISQGYYATSDQDPLSWTPSKNLIEIPVDEYDLLLSRGNRLMRKHESPGHFAPIESVDVPEGYTLTTGKIVLDKPNRISTAIGDGVSGNPTIDISSSYVGQATTTANVRRGNIQERLEQAGFPVNKPSVPDLLEYLPDMIIDIGRDGRNRVYSVRLKYSPINFTGSTLWEALAEVWIQANQP